MAKRGGRGRCDGCPLDGRIQVPFHGNLKAQIILFGESPGKDELKAGRLLKECCMDAGLTWSSMFIANSARCLIPKDDLSNAEMRDVLARCRPNVEGIIDALRPNVIIAAGGEAMAQVTRKRGIQKHRGKWIWSKEFECWVMPTFHPSFCMRPGAGGQAQKTALLVEDLAKVRYLQDAKFDMDATREKVDYRETATIEPLLRKIRGLADRPRSEWMKVSFDTETTSLDVLGGATLPLCYSISWRERTAAVVYLFRESGAKDGLPVTVLRPGEKGRKKVPTTVYLEGEEDFDRRIAELEELLTMDGVKLYMQHGSFDIKAVNAMLIRLGRNRLHVKNFALDTQVAAQVLDENMFEMTALEDLQYKLTSLQEDYSGRFKREFGYDDILSVPRYELTHYAGGDADVTLRVANVLAEELAKNRVLARYYVRAAQPISAEVLPELEWNGSWIDQEQLPKTIEETAALMSQMETDALHLVPKKLLDEIEPEQRKLSRTELLKDILFLPREQGGFGLKPQKFTKKKVPSTDKEAQDALLSMKISMRARQFLELMAEWRKYHTLYTRYLRGFERHIKPDGRIHSSYTIAKAKTGRVACLSGDTEVYVLDPREKVPIKDVRPGTWIITFDDALTPVPAKVDWAGKTGEQQTLLEVSFLTQGSRKKKSIRCTPDHRFRLRDGSWIEARNLTKGDRLLSLERDSSAGYRRVHATGSREFREHRVVYESVCGHVEEHVHHKDGDKVNNVPSNLEGLSSSEHPKRHGWTEESKQKLSVTLKRKHKNGEIRILRRYGPDNPCWKELDRDWCIKVLMDNKGKPTSFRDLYGLDYDCLTKKLEYLGIDWRAIRDRFDADGNWISDERIEEAKKQTKITYAMRILRVGWVRANKLLMEDNNHVVLSVDYAKGTHDVYDITVSEHHCFIANGVCVHNSQNPNMQNNPKRSKAAAIIRKLIAAPPGYVLLAIDQSQAELRWAAHLAEDPVMIRAYKTGDDIHLLTAEMISGKSREEMTDDEKKSLRFRAKAINFGVIYLMSPAGFVRHAKLGYGLEISEETASTWINGFFKKYNKIPDYHRRTIDFGRRNGYVVSPFGRRRRLPELHDQNVGIRHEAERQAVNHPIQHASSETVLLAAREILRNPDLPREEIKMVNVVHDELVLEVVDDERKILHYAREVKHIMENPPFHEFGIELKVPLECDVMVGRNLAEMKELAL